MPRLIYGAFAIDNAPITVAGNTATLTTGRGSLSIGTAFDGGADTVPVFAESPGQHLPVSVLSNGDVVVQNPTAHRDVLTFVDPDNPVLVRLFRRTAKTSVGLGLENLAPEALLAMNFSIRVLPTGTVDTGQDLIKNVISFIAGDAPLEKQGNAFALPDPLGAIAMRPAVVDGMEIWELEFIYSPINPPAGTVIASARNSAEAKLKADRIFMHADLPRDGGAEPRLRFEDNSGGVSPFQYTDRTMKQFSFADGAGAPMKVGLHRATIDHQGFRARFHATVNTSLDSRPEDLPQFAPAAPGGQVEAIPEYVVVPYEGEIHIATEPEPAGDLDENVDPPLQRGDIRLTMRGEIQPSAILDVTNAPIRLAGDAIILRHAKASETTSKPFACSPAGVQALPHANDRRPSLNFGDLQLELHKTEKSTFVTSHGHAAGEGEWNFATRRAVKTPLKKDSAASGLAADAGPRREQYDDGGSGGAIRKRFTSRGQLQSVSRNVMEGYTPKTGTSALLQPENATLTLGADRRLECVAAGGGPANLAERIRALADAATTLAEEADSVYTTADFKLEFPPLPGTVNPPIVPTLTWKETFAVGMPNTRIRTFWSPDLDAGARYQEFLNQNGLNLPLPFDWKVRLPELRDRLGLTIFEAVTGNANIPRPLAFKIVDGVVKELQPTFVDAHGALLFEPINVPKEWADFFPASGDFTQVVSPRDLNWCGAIVLNGRLEAPENLLPKSMSELLKKLPVSYASFDGNGVSAAVTTEVDLEKDDSPTFYILNGEVKEGTVGAAKGDKATLILGKTTIIIRQNKIQTFDLQFNWQIPFFSTPDKTQWITIRGRWEKPATGGDGELVLSASVPDGGLDLITKITGQPDKAFLGLKRLLLNKIDLTIRNGRQQISLDGSLEFDDSVGSLIREFFEDRLKSLTFRKWTFDFEDPLNSDFWKFPDLKLDTSLNLFPKGFDFALKSIQFDFPKLDTRVFKFFGSLKVGVKLPGFAEIDRIDLALVFTRGPGNSFGISFDSIGIPELEFTLFKLLKVKVRLIWEDPVFRGLATIQWGFSKNEQGKSVQALFVYGSGEQPGPGQRASSRQKFWVTGINGAASANSELDMFLFKAKEAVFVAAHRATLPGLRDNLLGHKYESIGKLLFDNGLEKWVYNEHSDWFFGLHFKELELQPPLPTGLITGRDATLFLSDDGLFFMKLQLRPLDVFDCPVELGIDWQNFFIGGSLTLPKLDYGAYKVDLGTVGFGIGKIGGASMVQLDWGYPFELRWERSIKLRWDPPPYPIPINAVQGGVFIKVAKKQNGGFALTTGVAVRVGYEFVCGSEGGAFGAYISGSIFLGSVTVGEVSTNPMSISLFGMVTFDAQARGGVVVFGMRWDIITVWVHASAGFRINITEGKGTRAAFSARFEAGFRICLTPCICVGGTIGFGYELDAFSPDSRAAFNPEDGTAAGVASDRLGLARIAFNSLNARRSNLSTSCLS